MIQALVLVSAAVLPGSVGVAEDTRNRVFRIDAAASRIALRGTVTVLGLTFVLNEQGPGIHLAARIGPGPGRGVGRTRNGDPR